MTVAKTISTNRDSGRGSLIGYLPVGYPSFSESVESAITLLENGVDILELGIPYSDPVMDGPVIQEATQLALANGFKLDQTFDAVNEIVGKTGAPVLLMSYWNPILQYGVERFAENLANAGGAGIITPDLVPDDAEFWFKASEKFDLDRIFLAAPTSTDSRLRQISEASKGFVYAVSTMGITGARQQIDIAARELVSRLRGAGSNEICVGLGISTKQQVFEVLEYADGAIVGSAFIRALNESGISGLAEMARTLSAGV